MGADCCGGATAAAAAAGVERLGLSDDQPGKGPRPWAEVVAEKTPYYQKRVQLFQQHQQRHLAEVEAAKAAASPITIILPGVARPVCCDRGGPQRGP